MKREPGFYWVKYEGKWIVAQYSGCWQAKGYVIWDDSTFEAIHETRLIPPKPPKTA